MTLLPIRSAGRRLPARRALVLVGVLAAFLMLAPAAFADTVSISLSDTSPEQSMPITITVSGSGAAADDAGDGPYLYAVVQPAGDGACGSSFGNDAGATDDASTVLEQGTQVDPGAPFSLGDSYVPDVGPAVVCAWLETVGDDGETETATPDEVTAGPVSNRFTASGPVLGPLKVSVPSRITADRDYTITYATQTDQDLDLDSVVIPTGTGGCADSYEDQDGTFSDVFGGSVDVSGMTTTTASDSEDAGTYVICTWIEGPDDTEVDAATSTKVTVTAASGSTSGASSGSSSGSSASASGPSGAATCVVPRYAGTTLAQVRKRIDHDHCAVGAVLYARTTKVKRGRVVRLSAAAGTHLRDEARLTVIVSLG